MTKVSALPLAKLVINVVERTTLELYASPERSMYLSQGVTQEKGQMEPTLSTEKNRCLHRCNVHEIHEDDCHDDSSIEDLNEQVQSSLLLIEILKKMMAR